ncbi:MAG: hypothetical protein D6731_13340 [Planctomycetota bacterium]|nr:MAG: hypothetical protein D6731_13340 [Planctomycetota bacterium]
MTAPRGERDPGASRRWTLAIVSLLGFGVFVHGVLLAYALSDPSAVAEPDYYAKALAWDEHLRQEAQNRALGWRLEVSATPRPSGQRLFVRLLDRDGRPLAGAKVHVLAFHKARRAESIEVELPEVSGGYAAELPARRPGLWELRFACQHGGQRFTLRTEHSFAAPTPDTDPKEAR